MKKAFFILGGVILLTGCGNAKVEDKKLNCSIELETAQLDTSFTFDSEGKELKEATMTGVYDISQEEAIVNYCKTVKSMHKDAECDFETDSTTVTVNAKMPIDKMSAENIKNLNFHGVNLYEGITYESLNSKIEANGATCK